MFFSLLPNELSSHVLNDWLDLKAVARLDSALCSITDRENHLFLLKNAFTLAEVIVDTLPKLNYLITREIEVRHIVFCMKICSPLVSEQRLKEWIVNMGDAQPRLSMNHIPSHFIIAILRCALQSKQITFNNCDNICREITTMLQQRQLQEIFLTNAQLVNFTLNPELQKLRIRFIFPHKPYGGSRIVFPGPMLQLQWLEMSGTWVTNDILIQFSLHCPNVVHLSIDRHVAKEAALLALLNSVGHLQSLQLVLPFAHTKELLDLIADRHGRSLHSLHLQQSQFNNPNAISNLLTACTNLSKLHLYARDFDRDVLKQGLPSVIALYVYSEDKTESILQAIADHWTQLQVLGLVLPFSAEQTFDFIEELCLVLNKCTKLHTVYLPNLQNTSQVTQLQSRLPKMQVLNDDFPKFDIMSF